ncbi:DNA polymerase I, thermostable [Arthrobacter saudimassiliensis]|uniref:DNA-directed DNA polymerase n=1 Tax=Arthrobacter saudimassiliensis TaxID=1461584 RepID=A0A078MS40_9MICC|nr:DNA polymerase I, thermostable [Arthrobacter saudimassiliensis]
MGGAGDNGGMYVLLARGAADRRAPLTPLSAAPAGAGAPAQPVVLQPLDEHGHPAGEARTLGPAELPAAVAHFEAAGARWVWDGTRAAYAPLLAAGLRVERCHDLALVRGILRFSPAAAATPYVEKLRAEAPDEDQPDLLPRSVPPARVSPDQGSLFDDAGLPGADVPAPGPDTAAMAAELAEQLAAVAGSPSRQRLALLCAAESAGGLVAAEMEHAGIPWRRNLHEAMLEEQLGPRPPEGSRPRELETLVEQLRAALGSPRLNPDSPQELIRALHRAGIEVRSTRSWELQQHSHPAIEPLLRYKKLARLLAANGWHWLDAWVHDDRFRTEYVVGGVVSGRWSSRGGGALQIPKEVRDAVRPDPGHRLVVADAAQLEPRVLAALGQDDGLAAAARGQDLYQGIADQGFGGDRAKAKMAMLGAMYGATSGEAGRLMPVLTRAYPRAIGVVEQAARTGEAGGTVASHLGRGCPPASERWRAAQRTASAEEQRRADALARSRGRFTRNFVVQASAAEWALCWLAGIRRRLRAASADGRGPAGELVFFLHDEVMLHVPSHRAEEAAAAVQTAAAEATSLLFGRIPLEFPVQTVIVDSYADAK